MNVTRAPERPGDPTFPVPGDRETSLPERDNTPTTPAESEPTVTTSLPVGQPMPEATDDGGDGGGVGLSLVLLLAVVAMAIGALGGAAASRFAGQRRTPTPLPAAPPPTAPGAAAAPPAHTVPQPDIGPLVAAVVDVRDKVNSEALDDQLGAGLASVGYVTVDPAGQPFDAGAHLAVDRETTTDPALDGVIALSERVGYRDAAGVLVRQPEVVVYRYTDTQEP